MIEIGTIINEKYEVISQIGKGGMSTVYLARDLKLNINWAVKEIKKTGKDRNNETAYNSLPVEADIMKKLNHPNLPRIIDIAETPDTIQIVMDYIEGQSLDKVLKMYGVQPQEVVIKWAKQLCDVLGYLHNQNPPIIYRDMKPANVMLQPDGNLKLIDFGTARTYKEYNSSDTHMFLTEAYGAPEQRTRAGRTDARTDIFCLGVTLYQLLTGKNLKDPPYYKVMPIRVFDPKFSGGLEKIILKCTQDAPEDRYQNCDELLYDLNHYQEVDDAYIEKLKKKRNRFIVLMVISLILICSGIGTRLYGNEVRRRDYENLINIVDSTAYSTKIANYKEAVGIYPGDTRAYIKMLDAYEQEGQFSKTENNEFLALYNQNLDKFNYQVVGFAQLNYQIGMLYFNYYSENGNNSLSTRIQKAYPFFETNFNNNVEEFENLSISNAYYKICSFYKKYILSTSTVEEASKEDFDSLLTLSLETFNDLENANAYDKLSFYNGVFMLIFDQRLSMASCGVEIESVENVIDEIHDRTSKLVVQKDQSKLLQNEILDQYENCKEAIQRAYGKEIVSIEEIVGEEVVE